MSDLKKRLFIKNAAILTATAVILRGIGIFFRIYISNTIGAEGMGLHQLILSIYMFASAVASSGISVAATRLVSEKIVRGGAKAVNKILAYSLFVSIILGLCAFALMYFCADTAAMCWLHDTRAALSLKILSFGLPFMAVSSCLKGYFTARRKASTPSNSQLFEQLIRILTVVILLSHINTENLSLACAAVVTGNTLSEIGACVYIYIGYLRDKRTIPVRGEAPPHILHALICIFVPVALSSYLNTILHTIENIMVPEALTRYTLSREISLSQFGMLKGMALPLLFFPSSFLGALSTLLMPEVSEYGAEGKSASIKTTINYTLLITVITSVPIGAVFSVYAYEAGLIIYGNADVGLYILALAPVLPFMYIESMIAGILNALNQQVASLRYNVYNSAIRIALILILVPHFGIYAFLAIMIVSNLFTSCLNMRQLFKVTNIRPDLNKLAVKPLLAAATALICTMALKQPLKVIFPNIIISATAGSLILCVIYTFFILISKCVTKEELCPLRRRG